MQLPPLSYLSSSIHFGEFCVAAIGYLRNVGQFLSAPDFTSPHRTARYICKTRVTQLADGRPRGERRPTDGRRVHRRGRAAKNGKLRLRGFSVLFHATFDSSRIELYRVG